MSEGWTVAIPSGLCPYRTQGGLDDNSASATLYTACIILKEQSGYDICCYMRCPRR